MPPVQEHLTSPSVHDAPIYKLHNALASFTSDLHFRLSRYLPQDLWKDPKFNV